MSSGWAVGAIIFGGVGPGVERLETGLLAGTRRSVRAVGHVLRPAMLTSVCTGLFGLVIAIMVLLWFTLSLLHVVHIVQVPLYQVMLPQGRADPSSFQ